jgi:hypothetical protein
MLCCWDIEVLKSAILYGIQQMVAGIQWRIAYRLRYVACAENSMVNGKYGPRNPWRHRTAVVALNPRGGEKLRSKRPVPRPHPIVIGFDQP